MEGKLSTIENSVSKECILDQAKARDSKMPYSSKMHSEETRTWRTWLPLTKDESEQSQGIAENNFDEYEHKIRRSDALVNFKSSQLNDLRSFSYGGNVTPPLSLPSAEWRPNSLSEIITDLDDQTTLLDSTERSREAGLKKPYLKLRNLEELLARNDSANSPGCSQTEKELNNESDDSDLDMSFNELDENVFNLQVYHHLDDNGLKDLLRQLGMQLNCYISIATIAEQQLQTYTDIGDSAKIKVAKKAYDASMQRILKRKINIKNVRARIKEVRSLRNVYSANVEMPEFKEGHTHLKKDMITTLLKAAKESETDFSSLWRKTKLIGEALEFSELNFRQAMPLILPPQMFEIYFIYKDESFETILLKLAELHGNSKLENGMIEIQTFKRKPGETIVQAMSRYSILLLRTAAAFPPEEQEPRRKLELAGKLRSICSEEAKKAIQKLILSDSKKGLRTSYEKMLDTATVSEHLEKTSSYGKGQVYVAFDENTLKEEGFNKPNMDASEALNRKRSIQEMSGYSENEKLDLENEDDSDYNEMSDNSYEYYSDSCEEDEYKTHEVRSSDEDFYPEMNDMEIETDHAEADDEFDAFESDNYEQEQEGESTQFFRPWL